jgi:hypothetical protein
MTLNFANHPTGFNYIFGRSLTETTFLFIYRSPKHLWQGFALPTEQKQKQGSKQKKQ